VLKQSARLLIVFLLLPSQEERKPGLWNADTHLHLMKLCETYRCAHAEHHTRGSTD
jgi:hypothetical protein